MKILIATYNPAKFDDYRKILSEKNFEVVSLRSFNLCDQAEEIKETYEENARDKALFYYHLAKIPTIADDGGFEIDYLGKQPGVRSRRWLGHESSDEEIIVHLTKVIKGIPKNQRTGRFVNVTCLVKSDDEIYFAKNSIEGYLTEKFNNHYPPGFPFRAFFREKTTNKFLMDLNLEEYNLINHRRKNIDELLKYL